MFGSRHALARLIGVGASAGVLLAAISAPPTLAQHGHHASALQAESEAGERAGEAGDGVEQGTDGDQEGARTERGGGAGGQTGQGAAAQSHRDVLMVLAQMQGHLLVAQELLEHQTFSAAEPHVGHPVDELYGALAPALDRRGIAPFLPTLEALRQQVRFNPASPATALQLAKAQRAVEVAAQTLNGGATTPAPLLLALVRQLGEEATQEYTGAIAGDQVVDMIDYQDARGFLLAAQRLLAAAIASQPADAAALMARQHTLDAMLKAFPAVMPPQKAVLSADQLQQLQQRL